jgi:hypothetical protein
MSLVKKHQMTEKKLAANRRNQSLGHGPVTAEWRERIHAARTPEEWEARERPRQLLENILTREARMFMKIKLVSEEWGISNGRLEKSSL